ncbi:hypothetical protein PF005_g11913 [Phytophthora fragariae]|uniref:Uncharacterized protein n=1 Tax=Phytophthora fragariae TaxID=53985 RepID=A0A6A3Y2R2_9STRA|nr:hypothetical protein PF009_g15499 [Phytophthora fragariae]KAE8997167.1 hypothetical protein PF011_g15597 [Phytophthora fragariae]KAE9078870.1 hypothetical protein PF010_g22973 [Phytophthora fragariae]KAE9100422.1 hypothetical protein PF006_g22905 [Phytophthora fragariae]KAE9110989.1 hypothetical protein PF007_g11650 [Phytophthora fragariae]
MQVAASCSKNFSILVWCIFSDVLQVCLLSLEKALDQIDQVALEALLPVVLLLNYTLLIYLAVFYWKRRRERRVMLLLCVGTLGTVAIIPFARPDQSFVEAVNDISEACCVLTFLLQITIIGYDLNKRFKMRSVMFLTYAAEVLILADLVSILLSEHDLAFIFIFRFWYIGISRGWMSIWRTRKIEVCCYLLFATHEMPFDLISAASGLNWEFAQAIWHRTTLTACLLITARTKIKRLSVANGTSTATNVSSASSGREKPKVSSFSFTKNSKGTNWRRIFQGKISPRLDFLVRKSGQSGGRRSSGPQTCTVAPMQQLNDM